ncbi:hypothetical protein THRCLA_03683 [Thraustotheca clavata]|uniref:PDZ domain-containing protein n=1 Tax=Thraustotheca clavata TaxID=74557 RepID=A0A1W0A196_9STRA|nr:hypothetical protein THRCLA_03683 [Thraustotheca clavata]
MDQVALQRAEEGEWKELNDLAENLPQSIMVTDEFGMLPLHWACTELKVPLDTIELLVKTFPEACETKNLSGMLPLHVAITNKLPALHLNVLVSAFPAAVFVKSGEGYFPAEMARKYRLPEHSINILKKAVPMTDRRSSLGMRMSSIGTSLNRRTSMMTRSESDTHIPSFSTPSIITRNESCDSNLKSFGRSGRSPSQASTASSVFSHPSAFDSQRVMQSMDGSNTSLHSLDHPDDSMDDISSELRDLSGQLQHLGSVLRSSSSISNAPRLHSVLWNPGDRLGMALESFGEDDKGARIKRFTGNSEAIGVDALQVGDVLVSINGISVSSVPFTTVCKFLKKTNVTCKLTFQTPEVEEDDSQLHYVSTSSTGSEEDNTMPPVYMKMASMLEETMVKVQSVEDILRLSSVMAV